MMEGTGICHAYENSDPRTYENSASRTNIISYAETQCHAEGTRRQDGTPRGTRGDTTVGCPQLYLGIQCKLGTVVYKVTQ